MSRRTRRRLWSGIFAMLCILATLITLAVLLLILATLLSKDLGGIDGALFRLDQPAPGSAGGLRNAIVGSLMMCGMAMAVALVVGVLAGTWLAEYGAGTRAGAVVRFVNDVLISAPSILVGIFAYQLLVLRTVGHFSGLAGAAALALLATPIVVRTTEEMLVLQAGALREAGMALGASRALVIRTLVWRAARSGLLTAVLLAFARISGETAPLLFTSLGNQFFSIDPGQPMASLPTTIFQFALSAYPDWQQLAWAGALLIAAAVLATNLVGRWIAAGGARA